MPLDIEDLEAAARSMAPIINVNRNFLIDFPFRIVFLEMTIAYLGICDIKLCFCYAVIGSLDFYHSISCSSAQHARCMLVYPSPMILLRELWCLHVSLTLPWECVPFGS